VPSQIRPFQPEDADELIEMSVRAWAPVFASFENVLGQAIFLHLYPDWPVNQAEAVKATVNSKKNEVCVAEDGGSIVGFVAVKLSRDHSTGEIFMLAVDSEHQNHGLGTALTTFALEQITGAGMTLAIVFTGGDPGHAPARRTYEKAEFTPLPVVRYYKAL
jgi:ribosomal protein S18 acetylase RimI-like enzyme